MIKCSKEGDRNKKVTKTESFHGSEYQNYSILACSLAVFEENNHVHLLGEDGW
jgi:hypothetical protein